MKKNAENEVNDSSNDFDALNALEKELGIDDKNEGEEVQVEIEPEVNLEQEQIADDKDNEPNLDEHGKKSREGRRIAKRVGRIEEGLMSLDKKFDLILEHISAKNAAPEQEEEFVFSEYPNYEELNKFKDYTVNKAKETAKQTISEVMNESKTKQQEYEQTYVGLMKSMLETEDEDDDVSSEIQKLMVSNDERFNCKHTGDATKDFLINYQNASRYIIDAAKGIKTKRPQSHTAPMGVAVPKTAQRSFSVDRSKMDSLEASLASSFSDKELYEMGWR